MFLLFSLILEFAILLESNSGGSKVVFLLLGPAAGVGFYVTVFTHYRNTNKSHEFEKETDVKVFNMKRSDQKIDELRGTREAKIRGENTANHRERVYPLHE